MHGTLLDHYEQIYKPLWWSRVYQVPKRDAVGSKARCARPLHGLHDWKAEVPATLSQRHYDEPMHHDEIGTTQHEAE